MNPITGKKKELGKIKRNREKGKKKPVVILIHVQPKCKENAIVQPECYIPQYIEHKKISIVIRSTSQVDYIQS